MSLHDHDRDLIMALAEGSLDAAAARTARNEIDSCTECRSELELQETALALFASAPTATMTELEAARLKRDLDTALGHERTVVTEAVPRTRRFNWAPVFSVAAVLLALVLVAPALQLVRGGGGDDSASEVAVSDFADEEAATEDTETRSGVMRLQDGDSSAVAENTEAAEAAPAPTTTAASAADDGGEATTSDVERLLSELNEVLSESDSVDDARLKAALFGVFLTEEDGTDLARCVPEGVAEFDITGVDSYTLGDTDAEVGRVRVTAHPMRSALGLAAHFEPTCEVIAINEG